MKTIKSALPLILSALALAVAISTVPMDASGRPKLGVSNLDSLHLRDANGTATPNFMADQRGSGVVAEFRDGATPVARIPNGGGFDLLVGNLSAPAFVASTGAVTISDNLFVDGQADVEQLVVQGYTTQTSALLVLEQSDGTDVFDVANDGSLSNSATVITVTDNVIVDGQADAEQLIIQGNGTQTSDILVVETSAGANLFDVDNSGNVELTGTLTLESVAFSGPVVFGTATSVVTGTTIAHGLGTTPTVAIVTAEHLTPIFTNTVYILSTDSTSITIGIGHTTGVTTIDTVHWMAGK